MTPIRRTLCLHALTNRLATLAARLTRAFIHEKFLSEVSGAAVRSDIISQGRAADFDGLCEHRLDRLDDSDDLLALEMLCLPSRTNSRPKERFARIDVADADDDLSVHQKRFDGHATAPRYTPKIVRIEGGLERFGSERGE